MIYDEKRLLTQLILPYDGRIYKIFRKILPELIFSRLNRP